MSRSTFAVLLLWLFLSSLSAIVQATNPEGLTFLEENEKKPGVVTLASGLQYKVLTKGKGPAHPTIDAPCSCHYEGKTLDGTVFDSSYERGDPTTFAPNQVIKGWTEA
jgi:FKBP-type peptidyl-prolyl cis-trans isomerase FklB